MIHIAAKEGWHRAISLSIDLIEELASIDQLDLSEELMEIYKELIRRSPQIKVIGV